MPIKTCRYFKKKRILIASFPVWIGEKHVSVQTLTLLLLVLVGKNAGNDILFQTKRLNKILKH